MCLTPRAHKFVHTQLSHLQGRSLLEPPLAWTQPGDYRVDRSVFEGAQERWGRCTVDAFASEPTALLNRFWTAKRCDAAEATDALRQPWRRGERIWAHPPPKLLPDLARLLQNEERTSEAIVCAPFWPSAQWYREIMGLSDDRQKYRAGMLQKVVDDAPGRLASWPIMLFRIPAPSMAKHDGPSAPARAPPAPGAPSGRGDHHTPNSDGRDTSTVNNNASSSVVAPAARASATPAAAAAPQESGGAGSGTLALRDSEAEGAPIS